MRDHLLAALYIIICKASQTASVSQSIVRCLRLILLKNHFGICFRLCPKTFREVDASKVASPQEDSVLNLPSYDLERQTELDQKFDLFVLWAISYLHVTPNWLMMSLQIHLSAFARVWFLPHAQAIWPITTGTILLDLYFPNHPLPLVFCHRKATQCLNPSQHERQIMSSAIVNRWPCSSGSNASKVWRRLQQTLSEQAACACQ